MRRLRPSTSPPAERRRAGIRARAGTGRRRAARSPVEDSQMNANRITPNRAPERETLAAKQERLLEREAAASRVRSIAGATVAAIVIVATVTLLAGCGDDQATKVSQEQVQPEQQNAVASV